MHFDKNKQQVKQWLIWMIANSARSTQISTKDLEHSRNEEGVKMRNHKRAKKNKFEKFHLRFSADKR